MMMGNIISSPFLAKTRCESKVKFTIILFSSEHKMANVGFTI